MDQHDAREIKNRQWRKKMLLVAWYAVAAAALVELAVFILVHIQGEEDSGMYVVQNLLRPILVGAAIMLAVHLICLLALDRQLALVEGEREANRASMLDSLTRLLNHAAFYDQLDRHILRQTRGGGGFCLLVFDIDNFKRVNDQYGHDTGDQVLLALVDAMNGAVGEGDLAFRYGGEEFTVLTGRGLEESYALSETIRAGFAERAARLDPPITITVSAGLCRYDPDYSYGRREFFASADEALYEAKRTGKDKTVIWTEALLGRRNEKTGEEGTKA